MSSYLPDAHSLGGAAGLCLTLVLFLLLGTICVAREETAETKLLAGWGAACLVLTLWGVATPIDLRWPLAGLAIAGLAALALPSCRAGLMGWGGVGRIALVALPLGLVMLPVMPSEIDTWLNLLPNAAYLFDFGMLPTSARPPSYSFLPVAPYNTQFAAFAASVATGAFRDGVMGLFNLALLAAAALLLARAVWRGSARSAAAVPPWWACAMGLVIAIPLNPGFVPRVFLSPYGEAPLAVTVLFAVWLATNVLDDLRHTAWPRGLAALALVLVAMVNIKQSGLGLVLPIGATMLALGVADKATPSRRVLVATALALLPALVLYGVWRRFATAAFPEGELKLLPFAEWNWTLLPGIAAAMLHVMFQKAAYFVPEGAVLVLAALRFRHALAGGTWSRETRLLALTGGTILGFTGFLVFTYVAHFPPVWALEAHSYFRYASQLSLAVMLCLILAARPFLAARLAAVAGSQQRRLAAIPVAAAIVMPILGVGMLRFDLETPQPEIRRIARDAAPHIEPGARIALLLPDDLDDADASMLRGVLMFTPPRRRALDLRIENTADAATLASLAADGFRLALVTCTPTPLADVPAGRAALLSNTDGAWHSVETTALPPGLAQRRFAAMLQRGPLCAARKPAALSAARTTP
jgi:hypothetical protein